MAESTALVPARKPTGRPVDGIGDATLKVLARYDNSMRRRNLARGTRARYLTDLRTLARGVHPTPLVDASAEQIELHLDGRNLKAAQSRYRLLSQYHTFYRWALVHGEARRDPTVTIERPRLSRRLPRPIADEPLAFAIRVAGPEMRAWLVLMAFAGLRCAEVASLDRSGITAKALRIHGKGDRERVVPMHPAVRVALKEAALARTGPVFRSETGQPYRAKEISRRVALFFRALGIEATAHQCRHAFGTRAYAGSRDLRAVQELMGHADPTTTAGYAAVAAVDLADVIEALPPLEVADDFDSVDWP